MVTVNETKMATIERILDIIDEIILPSVILFSVWKQWGFEYLIFVGIVVILTKIYLSKPRINIKT